jgi:hypothetical protein
MGMAERRDEPQSHFIRSKDNPSSQRRGDFYANGQNRGRAEEEIPEKKVTSVPSGAKRDGYFKNRDY